MSFLSSRIAQSFRAPLRAAVAARPSMTSVATRTMSASALRLSEHHEPLIQGSGAPNGAVPTDEEQSTGLERFELMGKHQGIDVFDMTQLQADRRGTMSDPIIIKSMVRVYKTRLIQYPVVHIGCTGYPADSQETVWITLTADKEYHRCVRSGNGAYRTRMLLTAVYKLELVGNAEHH